jgi:glutamyl-tRNA reductase
VNPHPPVPMPLPRLVVAGLSHRTAPVELLGRCALPAPGGPYRPPALGDRLAIPELVALSTCNRREIYAAAPDPAAAGEAIARALAQLAGLPPSEVGRSVYVHQDERVARHLFRVAASLDSMVLGESEIQGQVRRGWELAREEGAGGPMLDRLFRRALSVGRRVRRDTRIGAGRVSVPSVAVGLLERTAGRLAGLQVLVVGAGEMARVVADALAARRAAGVAVLSRRAEAAHAVAAPRGWRSGTLAALPAELPLADVVICATAAPRAVVSRRDVERALAERPGRPMALIDMAVPADVDPAAAALPGVTLHTMEDIRELAAAGSVERLAQAELAEAIVAAEVDRFAEAARWVPMPLGVPVAARAGYGALNAG